MRQTSVPVQRRGVLVSLGLLALGAAPLVGCTVQSAYERLVEALRLTADLRVQFVQAADAANRAVMADTDEASIAFAKEAEQAKNAVLGDAAALAPLLRDLRYTEEARLLGEFNQRFAAYQLLDRDILELAVENTNLKAQRLSFGPGREAADAFKGALAGLTRATSPGGGARVESLVASAVLAVREIQVIQAPHIAEADDAAMTRMEEQMSALEAAARNALRSLSDLIAPTERERLAVAIAALDRFKEVHVKIVALSRRNSNVRSQALAVGRKRALAAACEASLAALEAALSKEGSKATR